MITRARTEITRPLLIMTAMIMIGLLGPASVARADAGLLLSLDGRHWSTAIDQPLFDSDHRWVPGDAASVRFWVRNDRGRAVDLRIDVVDVRGTLRVGRDIVLTSRLDGRPTGTGERLVAEAGVDGRPRRVDLTAELPTTAGNETQLRAGGFRLRVVLVSTVTAASGSERPGALAATGGPAAVVLVGSMAALLVGLGAGSLARPTTRRRGAS